MCSYVPTFPALFLGAAAGLLAAVLPGFSETPAVAIPLIVVAVVVAYITTEVITARRVPPTDGTEIELAA